MQHTLVFILSAMLVIAAPAPVQAPVPVNPPPAQVPAPSTPAPVVAPAPSAPAPFAAPVARPAPLPAIPAKDNLQELLSSLAKLLLNISK